MKTHVVCLIGALTLGGSSVANGQLLYHAKITLETGTPLPRVPQIIVGKAQNFAPACIIANLFGNGTITWYANPYALRGDYDRKNMDQCPITIRLDGYQKTDTVL